ncbi:hypothetical protein [Plantactinospora sp. CA-290183]|uniref:hypothetical protein n=1 Tax=Plantactinospora sp. CA-290183 TaxID=3240006 RepID=UPI003D89B842
MRAGRSGRSVAALVLCAALVAGCGIRPSGVIPGGPAPRVPAMGTGLYLVSEHQLALVLRPTGPPPSPAGTLAMLLGGPDPTELARGLRTEIPPDAGPAALTVEQSGVTVTLATDVAALPALAVDQIVCTLSAAVPTDGRGPALGPAVTLVGPGGNRRPGSCPLSG